MFAGLGRLEIAMKALDFDVGFSPMSYADGIELLAHLHALFGGLGSASTSSGAEASLLLSFRRLLWLKKVPW